MPKASLVKELLVKTQNKVGMMAEVSEAISKAGANISALNAFGVDKDAIFRVITSDNSKAANGLKAGKIDVSERDVVKLDLENRVGLLASVSKKLKDAGIDIIYIYGSTCGGGCASSIFFNCSNNKKAAELLNT